MNVFKRIGICLQAIVLLVAANLMFGGEAKAAPPVVSDQSITIAAGSPRQTIELLIDVDPYVMVSNIVIVDAPAKGTAYEWSPGEIAYVLGSGTFGIDTFSYYVIDIDGNTSNTATVTVNITAPPTPTASNQSVNVPFDASYHVFNLDIDIHPDNGIFEIVIVDSPAKGFVNISTVEQLAYSANYGESGSDSFTYYVVDLFGSSSNTATVTVEIETPLSLPVADLDGEVGKPFSYTLQAIGGTGPYTYELFSPLPDGLTFSADTISGIPATAHSIPVYYWIEDAAGSRIYAEVFFSIYTPAPPVLESQSIVVPVDETFLIFDVIPAVQFNDATIVSPPTKGTASYFNSTQLIYVPRTGETGSDTFSYFVTDAYGQTSNTVTVTVEILARPVITLPAATFTLEIGKPFSQKFEATGGRAPYTYTPIGYLPDGLTMTGDTISGVPTTVTANRVVFVEGRDADGFWGYGETTFNVTGITPAATNTTLEAFLDGPAVDIDLADHSTGTIDTYAISAAPTKGTVTLTGSVATYTPNAGEFGTDSFDWTVTGPSGTATATVTVEIKGAQLPTAIDHTLLLDPTQSGTIDLTVGASGGPFSKAHLLDTLPASTGDLSIAGTAITFRPHKAFEGLATVRYQLENASGLSNIATIEFIVAARPDPSADPEVIGLLTAQAQITRQFADDQISNIGSRLDQLRNEPAGERLNSMKLTISGDNNDRDPDDMNSAIIGRDFNTQSPWAVWSSGQLTLAETNDGKIDISASTVGASAGVDYRFTPDFVGGISIGYGQSHAEIGSNGTETTGKAYSATVYGSYHPSSFFLDALLGYQHVEFESLRYVTANGQTAEGKRDGGQIFGAITAGYDFKQDNGLQISPYVGIRGSHGSLNGFSETGGGIYGLTYGSQDVTSLSGVVGVRIEKDIELDKVILTPSARIEYRHEFMGGHGVNLGYTDIGTTPYRASIPGRKKDTVSVGVGLKARPKKDSKWSIEATLGATFGDGQPRPYVAVRAQRTFCGLFTPESACIPGGPKPAADLKLAAKAKAEKAKSKKSK